MGENEGIHLDICVGYGELSLESDGKNEKKCTYLVCDFNERWLKDSSFFVALLLY